MKDKLIADVMDAHQRFLLCSTVPEQYKALGDLLDTINRLRSQLYDDAQHDSGIFAAIKEGNLLQTKES